MKRVKKIAFYSGLIILITGIIVIERQKNAQQVEQHDLLLWIRNLDGVRIQTVKLIPGYKPLRGETCLTIEDSAELKELAYLFSRADDTYFGGHQTPQFLFKFYVEFVEGDTNKYLIRTYERFPDDIFLNVYSYVIHGDGSYSYSLVPEIRIPGLYPWLRDRVVRAGCPTE